MWSSLRQKINKNIMLFNDIILITSSILYIRLKICIISFKMISFCFQYTFLDQTSLEETNIPFMLMWLIDLIGWLIDWIQKPRQTWMASSVRSAIVFLFWAIFFCSLAIMSLNWDRSPTRWSISRLMLVFWARVALKLIMTPSSLFSSSMIFWLRSFFSLPAFLQQREKNKLQKNLLGEKIRWSKI